MSSQRRWYLTVLVFCLAAGVVLFSFATVAKHQANQAFEIAKHRAKQALETATVAEFSHTGRTDGTECRKVPNSTSELCSGLIVTGTVSVTTTVKPSPVFDDSDAEVHVLVNTEPKELSGEETVRLESESFKIVPHDPRVLGLGRGKAEAQFVLTPKGRGEKLLHVFAHHTSASGHADDDHEEIVKLNVVPRPDPTILGLTMAMWTALQGIGAAIGVPGLLALLITKLLDARKKKVEDNKPDDAPKIILPK